jgi:hypothetical protein
MRSMKWLAALPIAAVAMTTNDAVATPSACDAVPGNLVVNCGFENGSTGWSNASPDFTLPHTGLFSSDFEGTGGAFTIPSQTINGLTVGQSYDVSFWALNANTPSPSVMTVTLGTDTIFTNLVVPASYTQYTTTDTARASSEVLTFQGTGYGYIDDVVITQRAAAAIPEPAGLAVTGAGLAGLAGLTGLRRRRAA